MEMELLECIESFTYAGDEKHNTVFVEKGTLWESSDSIEVWKIRGFMDYIISPVGDIGLEDVPFHASKCFQVAR